ncbi:TRAP transporter small permease subunit [Microbacterium sp. NPDC077644]|jgi:TRAP-type C4-dicarboxylate transport system permease small subunit|uniref:TRAP transporter small permease n=1 Tax=Microbacterium sp. NPDC077644 TaxID=3155055 RepID=UPI00344D8F9D
MLFTKYVSRPLGVLAGAAVFILMALTLTEVISRAITGRSMPGIVEYSEVVLAISVFLALGLTQAEGQHITTSIMTSRLSDKPRRVVIGVFGLVGIIVVVVMVAVTAIVAIQSIQTGEYRFGLAKVPLSPARVAVVIGLTVFLVEYGLTLRREVFTRSRDRDDFDLSDAARDVTF